MASESGASWHPAFMPNSTADIPSDAIRSSLSSAPEALLESTKPGLGTTEQFDLGEPEDGPLELDTGEESLGNNDGHPELSDLRGALTKSLASPGGVELEEHPLHNGTLEHQTTEQDKAEFPSKGPSPTHANKHLSTMSFARTVSEDVNWGEDDDVDPEWNIQRRDTDPFKFMAKSDRTNSFPAVPPVHGYGSDILDEPLPQSQAEDIMNAVEQEPRDFFGEAEHDVEGDFFTQHATSQSTTDGCANEGQPGLIGDANYGQAYGGDIHSEEDEKLEARFEEGLPLVQQDEEHQMSSSVAFLDDGLNDEEDFFAQVSKTDLSQEETALGPRLERKSTMQVMASLHVQPYAQTQDDITEDKEIEGLLDRTAGGGIAASSSTISTQVLGDPDAPIHGQPEALATLSMESGDRDLADLWKSALADDEFLPDDELLPDDDEPTDGNALDPATLFGSDDEGFLDDNEDQSTSNDLFSQQTRPPIPDPVKSANGHVVGSSSLTRAVRPSSSGSSRYLPSGVATQAPLQINPYTPSTPLLNDLSRPGSTAAAPSPYASPAIGSFLPQQQRPELPKAQSFANKSKGGYASPYDLPMDVVKPRLATRSSMQQMRKPTGPLLNAPPPRSSSMHAQPASSRHSVPSMTTRSNSPSLQQSSIQHPAVADQPQPADIARKSRSGFFEELPVSSKPKIAKRKSSNFGSPAAQSPYGSPTDLPSQAGPGLQNYAPSLVQQHPVQPPVQSQGLVAPERVSPYSQLPTAAAASVPAAASRYSPAPSQSSSYQMAPPPPGPQSRYSPAPPNARQPSHTVPPLRQEQQNPVLPHQPRTSSPLAHFERHQESRPYGTRAASFDRRSSSGGHDPNLTHHHLPPTREVDESEQVQQQHVNRNYGELQNQFSPQAAIQPQHSTRAAAGTPPPQSLARLTSPPKRGPSDYLPQDPNRTVLPPKRSQTQSPGSRFAGPRLEMTTSEPCQRPASVEGPLSPRNNASYPAVPMATSYNRPRGLSRGLDYIAPTDGREHDPLQRWKGAPVFAWGIGGTIMTSFPTDVPRYGINQTVPMIVRSPGPVKIRSVKDIDPLQERVTSFPGPLKGKAKKKDVVTWLHSGIEMLEQSASYPRTLSHLSHDDKRIEERILLWKILCVFIENDGTLEGSAVVDKAVRAILSPGIDDEGSAAPPLYATGAELSGIAPSSISSTRSDSADPAAVDQLRRHLLQGDREKAVWEAVDKRLWAHAMLISNTVSKGLYKQVAQEFVQKEVKNIGENTESLAALYEIFAGNFEESVDELVPPSARAGFQMVSTTTSSSTSKDALGGLDRWRETLGLVLSNRSTDDSQALHALGKLLSSYGRAEAAHICFLFARTHSVFGGIDDPLSSIVLVGSDHLRQPHDFDRELEPILLSEVYEYGLSLSSASTLMSSSPHLAVYKLQHAKILSEYGYRDKALQYAEAIAASITSQTRRSPYHHSLLLSELDDLSKRLKQSPKDEGGSGWISKPSIDKAKGSFFATFNKFVAGDDTEEPKPGSSSGSATDTGPFARIAGGTPTISRSPSTTELYGSYNGGLNINGIGAAAATTIAGSRYAPSTNQDYSSSYGSQPRTSLDGRPSGEFYRNEPQRKMSDYRPGSQGLNSNNAYTPNSSYTPHSSFTPFANGSPHGSSSAYAPQTPVIERHSDIYQSPQPHHNLDMHRSVSYSPQKPSLQHQPSSSYEPHSSHAPSASSGYEPPTSNSYEPPTSSGYEPADSGYKPPIGGYNPPSYEPATIDEDPDSLLETQPKQKSFMDDNDDDDNLRESKAAPASRKMTKAEKDREADEAFRKAAEADAQKDKSKEVPAKKGWGLGGWFGGGAKKEADMGAQPNKPIRAKLGEASSFVFDPELKRWVNKKAGAEQTEAKSATPPPPRMGPPRTQSGPPGGAPPPNSVSRAISMGGPAMVAQRAVSEVTAPPMPMLIPSSAQAGDESPSGSPAGSLVPGGLPALARSVSNGSIGLGANRSPSAPPSRPSTGMSNASDIDDLLGPAVARKGAAKKKAKKGRYIDVMDKGAA